MRKSRFFAITSVVLLFGLATVLGAEAQTLNVLASFEGSDGQVPQFGALVQGTNGNFYGTTAEGGTGTGEGSNGGNNGVLFEITPSGTLTPIYNFCSEANCADGYTPQAQPVLATNGNLFGTTYGGGANGYGIVYEVTPAGKLTVLYSFCSQDNCTDGSIPWASPIQAANGNFYGTTSTGGNNNQGVIYEITPAGKYSVLYNFCSLTNCTDGAEPLAGLVQATNGNFYGTTASGGGGAYGGGGVVYEVTSAGKFTVLYNFCSQINCADGSGSRAALVQAANGNFYGTTYSGGEADGTIFEITPTGRFTSLHSFCGTQCGDGAIPNAPLIQATNGNFYGTTDLGGANEDGVIFELIPPHTLNILYNFCSEANCTDGSQPEAGLLQATNGTFYGLTTVGGLIYSYCTLGCGTVFSLSEGLGPFVETLPTSGKVGVHVTILGNNLTGATAVSFNGTAAAFSVVSSSEIKTTVPSGATTGTINVTQSTGSALASNLSFRVTPQLTSFAPPSGPVGTVVTITGVSLTQTTEITFGGVKAASFTVDSDTQVSATVPTGAKTGKIVVTTQGGTASSATSFAVTE